MTRDVAHHKLETFLCKEKLRGSRRVLVVTGKGHGKIGIGILKRKVPLWLEASKIVYSWAFAEQRDGGAGALYVYLK
jgi:DNA-nicking Smr family endonuclease